MDYEKTTSTFRPAEYAYVPEAEFKTALLTLEIPPKSDTFLGYIRGWKRVIKAFNMARSCPAWTLEFRTKVLALLEAEAPSTSLTTFDDDYDAFLYRLAKHNFLWQYDEDADTARDSREERELLAIVNERGGKYLESWEAAVRKLGV